MAIVGSFTIPAIPHKTRNTSFRPTIIELDLLGGAVGVTCLLLINVAWNQAPIVGWQEPYTYALLLVGTALTPSFMYIELRVSPPPKQLLAWRRHTMFVLAASAVPDDLKPDSGGKGEAAVRTACSISLAYFCAVFDSDSSTYPSFRLLVLFKTPSLQGGMLAAVVDPAPLVSRSRSSPLAPKFLLSLATASSPPVWRYSPSIFAYVKGPSRVSVRCRRSSSYVLLKF